MPDPVATVVPFPVLVNAAALAHVTPLALEHVTFTALIGGLLHPVNAVLNAFTWTVNDAGLNVVLNETFVVDGVPVTLTSGSLEVKVIELGDTLALLTTAFNGGADSARMTTATIAAFTRYM